MVLLLIKSVEENTKEREKLPLTVQSKHGGSSSLTVTNVQEREHVALLLQMIKRGEVLPSTLQNE